MSDLVTPVILTLDEGPNLARVLARLTWAREVVVIDSGSTDDTLTIAAAWPNVRVVVHPFESFAAQWQFALHDAGVSTPWILGLDADQRPDDTLLAALAAFAPAPAQAAFSAAFTWCVHGRPLRASLYPPREVLFRRDRVRFEQVGHKQVLHVEGAVGMLPGRLLHDDRKPLSRWLQSQWRYAQQEASHIDGCTFRELGWSGRLRKAVLPAPPAAFLVAWLLRGGVLDGRAGLYYALERGVAESLIAMALLRRRFANDEAPPGC